MRDPWISHAVRCTVVTPHRTRRMELARRSLLVRLAARGGRTIRHTPRAAWACFLIAFVNAAIWGVVVPPFQVPDEVAHFSYAQYFAETGKPPPQGPQRPYSPQEEAALGGLYFTSVTGHASMRGILTPSEDKELRNTLALSPNPLGQGGSTPVTNQPPLYYALQAIPYWLSPSQDILTRLAVMRLFSALMAAFTVLITFLFLRELLPDSPWAWTVGALAVAFQPTFDFIAAGVQGDNLLFLLASLLFLLLLRTYKRGLTRSRAIALGVTVAAGVLTKLTFIALLPGIAVALALLFSRAFRQDRRGAIRMMMLTCLIAIVPVALYALLNVTVWHRGSPTAGGLAGATHSALPGGRTVSLRETLDYIWELYLPSLWFMNHIYFGNYPLWSIWLDGTVGHFGWLDYTFPNWVYNVARYVFWVLAALSFVGVARLWPRVRRALPLFGAFGIMALGLLSAIGYAGIRYRLSTGNLFEQARYIFPLVVFYALFIVLAARALPRRWAPVLGGALLVLAMAHGLFAETLTISRYYG